MKEGVQIPNYVWMLRSDDGLWYEGPKVEAPDDKTALQRFLAELSTLMRHPPSHSGFEYVKGISHQVWSSTYSPNIEITLHIRVGRIDTKGIYWVQRLHEI